MKKRMLLLIIGIASAGAQQPLTLQDALSQAMQHNPRLQAFQAHSEIAAARARAVRGMLGAQVAATGWFSQGTLENMLFSTPSVMPDSMRMTSENGFGSSQLKLQMPLFTGGRLQGMAQAARAESNAMSAEVQEMQQEVRLEVTERYLMAVLQRQMVDVAEKEYQAQREETRIMQEQYEAGRVPLAFLLRSRAAEARTLQALTNARNEAQKSLLDLGQVIGIDLGTPIAVPESADVAQLTPPGTLNEALRGGLEGRAALIVQRFRQQMARAELRAARGAQLPQAYLSASLDWLKPEGASSKSGYTVALIVSVPIWNNDQLRSEVQAANARIREEEANLKTLYLQVENEIRRAWLDIQASATNLQTAHAALQDAEESYRVAALRVREGKTPLVEELDALAALTDARTRYAAAEFDYKLAQARLLRAMGKL